MKPLNRPMFRMGGPIKEGIMDGIEEPRTGFANGSPPGIFGFTFDQPFSLDMLKGPRLLEREKQKALEEKIKAETIGVGEQFPGTGSRLPEPDFSMTDLYKTPVVKRDLLASIDKNQPIKISTGKMEMVDPETITTKDIDITDVTKTEQVPFKSKTMLQKEKEFASGKILSDPDKTPKDPKADSELLQKLGYDRAVKKGNYALIEAIRKGLTEGGVQGALDAAFAAGATDPYGEASKIRQAAALKEYERKTDLEDYEKKLKLKAKIDTKQYSDSVRTKDFNFAKNVLKMTDDEALAYANKSSSVAENVFKVTSKTQGGFVAPEQLGDAIRAANEKVDAVFQQDDQATIEAYEAKDGEYVVFNQKIFIGYKDPNSDEILLKRVR